MIGIKAHLKTRNLRIHFFFDSIAVFIALCFIEHPAAALSDENLENKTNVMYLLNGVTDNIHAEIVALYDDDVFVCSGVLIAPNVVLTAAHCVLDESPDYVEFSLPDSDENKITNIVYFLPHMDYVGSLDNDIGILVINDSFGIQPSKIHNNSVPVDIVAGQGVTMIGYGQGNDKEEMSVRRNGTGVIDRKEKTRMIISPQPAIACFGDSGGAVYGEEDGEEYLIGIITSADSECEDKTIVTRVDAYIDSFINQFILKFEKNDVVIGEKCYHNSNCKTQYCWSKDGIPICTKECKEDVDCPEEMICQLETDERTSVCVPRNGVPGLIGATCETNYDCKEHLCLQFDDMSKKTCSRECMIGEEENERCPMLFECFFVENGAVFFACRESSNEPYNKKVKYGKSCHIVNVNDRVNWVALLLRSLFHL